MQVSLKTFVPTMISTLMLCACEGNNFRTTWDCANDYMKDRPYSEYVDLVNGCCEARAQSRLDSLAYKEILDSTAIANDTNVINDYNKIAAANRGYIDYDRFTDKYIKIEKAIIKQGISKEELDSLRSEISFIAMSHATQLQHLADKWTYKNFFTKIGIMNDSIAKKFEEVSEKIRPYH